MTAVTAMPHFVCEQCGAARASVLATFYWKVHLLFKKKSRIAMSDRSKSAERLKTPVGNKSATTPKLPSVRPPTRTGAAASQKSHAGPAGNSNPNYTEREQEKLMSKWRINVSRSRLCESAKCSFGGWRCPECVKEIVFGHCLLFEEMEGKVNVISCLLYFVFFDCHLFVA